MSGGAKVVFEVDVAGAGLVAKITDGEYVAVSEAKETKEAAAVQLVELMFGLWASNARRLSRMLAEAKR